MCESSTRPESGPQIIYLPPEDNKEGDSMFSEFSRQK